jgi:hypothetical protein|tara:strand:- start:1005 stop:1205 length:201 start_codon:yes stop_codon:yes gene_type:complete
MNEDVLFNEITVHENLTYADAVMIIDTVVRFAKHVSQDQSAATRLHFMLPFDADEIDQAWQRIQQG